MDDKENKFMKIIKSLAKKWWVWVIIVLLLLVVVPLSIHCLFKISSDGFFSAEWTAGDALAFGGSILGFIGTVVLGSVAVWQNKQLRNDNKNERNEQHKEMINLENQKIILANKPIFIIQSACREDYIAHVDSKELIYLKKEKTYLFMDKSWLDFVVPAIESKDCDKIIAITNAGNNAAHQVKLFMELGDDIHKSERAISVDKNESLFLYLNFCRSLDVNEKAMLTLRYFDVLANVYEQKFEIVEREQVVNLNSVATPEMVVKSNNSIKGEEHK